MSGDLLAIDYQDEPTRGSQAELTRCGASPTGSHCLCAKPPTMTYMGDRWCCWCGAWARVSIAYGPDPDHGPYSAAKPCNTVTIDWIRYPKEKP